MRRMPLTFSVMACSVMACSVTVCCLVASAGAQDRNKPKQTKRAKLPTFEGALTTQFFFDNVFAKLIGKRPATLSIVVATGVAPSAGTPNQVAGKGSYPWAKIISSGTIEDEVKAIKLAVDKNVTTPSDFAGLGYKAVRREFSMLAMLFGIINDYDGEVRWKNDSVVARDLFARSASNAKAGGNSNVFKEAQMRRDDLGRLLRGSGLNGQPRQPENTWVELVDRTLLMQRLEIGFNERLTSWTSSRSEFSKNHDGVLHEAEIIAAIGKVLTMGWNGRRRRRGLHRVRNADANGRRGHRGGH